MNRTTFKRRLSEMIGRAAPVAPSANGGLPIGMQPRLSVDWTQADYAFWSRLRRGKQKGYELGGLFAQPIGEVIAAWVLGQGFEVAFTPLTQSVGQGSILPPMPWGELEGGHRGEGLFAAFLHQNHQTLLAWVYDALTLGDGYLVVNPDATLTLVPPNQVRVITDERDWQQVAAYRITTRLDKATLIDEYRRDGRTLTVKVPGKPDEVSEYQNLTGRLPVIHLANDREANEVYGHPIYEGLLTLFAEYDDVLRKSLDGVKVMGHPVPVAEGLEDPQGAMELNATDTEQWTDASGHVQQRAVIDFRRLSMLFLGKGGTFKFASPGAFTQDSGRLLEYLFLLMLQHSKIPEWAWGGAIASSKASVEAQLPAFTRFIEGRRAKVEPALVELLGVWWATRALIEPLALSRRDGSVTRPGLFRTEMRLIWPPLTPADDALTLRRVEVALGQGLMSQDEARRALGVGGVARDRISL